MASHSDGAAITGSVTPPSAVVQRNATNEAIEGTPRLAGALSGSHSLAAMGQSAVRRDRLEVGISDDCAEKLYGRAVGRMRKLLGPGNEPG